VDISPALVGVLLIYAIQLTGAFAWGVRMSAETENQMTYHIQPFFQDSLSCFILRSVERIVEYGKLNPEPEIAQDPELDPSSAWPERGSLKFQGTTCKYREHLNPVLKDVSFEISPGEKVGICGR